MKLDKRVRLPEGAPTRAEFEFEVYPAELEYVEDRRRAHDLPLRDRQLDKPTTRHGLVGLAFSGGGIRSATFNLGVVQALDRWGVFKHFDLLSTVSGGGFIGSSITSLMSGRKERPTAAEFPFGANPFGGEKPAAVHLRNNSNYLAPQGLIDFMRMFAVLLRGIILNFLVLVPFLLVPCMIITLFYGRQLLERLEYDDTVDRTVTLMRTAIDRSNAAGGDPGDWIEVAEKKPVRPLLAMLKNEAFLPPDLVRNDEPVADALRFRNPEYRDVKEALATGSANPFSPLTFLPAVDLEKVAKRLIDAEALMRPETIEETWVAEHALSSTSPPPAEKRSSSVRTPLERMLQRLRPHLPAGPADRARAKHRPAKPMFMVFVTEESLLEALRTAELAEQVECKGEDLPEDCRRWVFKSEESAPFELESVKERKADRERRAEQLASRRWMQATQAFYSQRLFDPEGLRYHLARTGVVRELRYRWPDDAPGHLEVERAAQRLWRDLGCDPTVSGLFEAANRARQAQSSSRKRSKASRQASSPSGKRGGAAGGDRRPCGGSAAPEKDWLLAKDLEERGDALIAALAGAGLLVKDKACPEKSGPGRDWASRTRSCEFVEGQLHRLPGFLYEREFYERDFFENQTKQKPPLWSWQRWFGPRESIRYGRGTSSLDKEEVQAAGAELALRPGTVPEVMRQLAYATEGPAGRSPLVDARPWEPRMDGANHPDIDLPKSLLEALEAERLVRCDSKGLESCRFASRLSVEAIPGLLYRHGFYHREWFVDYFAAPKPKKPDWLKNDPLFRDSQQEAWKHLKASLEEWRNGAEADIEVRVEETAVTLRDQIGLGRQLADGSAELETLKLRLKSFYLAAGDFHAVVYRAEWDEAWRDRKRAILEKADDRKPVRGKYLPPATLLDGLREELLAAGLEEQQAGVEIRAVFKRLENAGHLDRECRFKNRLNSKCRFADESSFDRAIQWLMEEERLGEDRETGAAAIGRRSTRILEGAYERLVRDYFLDPSWNPTKLNLPFTQFVAISGLLLVLLFPVATLLARDSSTRELAAGGFFRRSYRLVRAFLARGARFFNRDRSFSLFMLLVAGAAFLDLQPYLIYHWHHLDLGADWSMAIGAISIVSTVVAGPALSFFKKFGRAIVILGVSMLGPLLPLVVYLSLLNELIYDEGWPTRDGYEIQALSVVLFFLLAALVVHLFVLSLNPNSTAMHGFYRKRLGRAYLLAETARGDIKAGEDPDLSEICPQGSGAPYHLLNVSLNLQASDDPNVRDRNSDFFIFSRLFVGGGVNTGYCRTERMEELCPELTLGGAMAISAAAAAPNMGAFTVGPLVILLALLNIRLGYWVPNPRHVREWLREKARGRGTWLRHLPARLLGLYRMYPGPYLFLRELLSRIHDKSRAVNVSDGGHLENTAIFELLRRRCSIIVAGDAEADEAMNFGGLAVLQRLARIDLSTEIRMSTADLRPENGKSARHFAVGEITYPETAWAPRETGYLIYLKSSLTGDESQVVSEYAGRRPQFPHESTGDQFFDEGQFEAYRDLGSHSVDSLFEELGSPSREEVGGQGWLERAVLGLRKGAKAPAGGAQMQRGKD